MKRTNYRQTLLSTLTIAMFTFSVYAAEPSDTINIDEVVVSGHRIEVARTSTPMSISVISHDEIRNQEETNILPVVAKITPSLFVSEIGVAGYALGNSTSGQVTIRGVGGSPNARVMMLVDGQPQYMGVFGHPLPNFHMASNVERVEVVRVPASLLYGIWIVQHIENRGFSWLCHEEVLRRCEFEPHPDGRTQGHFCI
jgi:outer membrane receptor for ferrienterochelin and colicin